MAPRPRPTMAYPSRSRGVVEQFTDLWSSLAGLLFIWSMLRPYLPLRFLDRFAGGFLRRHARRLDPYLTVTVAEFDGAERLKRGEVYDQAKAYLAHRCSRRARSLRAERAPRGGSNSNNNSAGGGGDRFVLTLGDNEEVTDEFRGATVWWHAVAASRRAGSYYYGAPPWYGGGDAGAVEEAGRAYRLVFHQRHRDLVVESYLPHVCREGRALMAANRRRKLYTNTGERYRKSLWSHVVLDHPSTFATLAMDPAKKQEIMDDLDAFKSSREYYRRIGKAWKRGYLLYGPPGTGKSTMVAAMANHLDYDIYDVELTSVHSNTDLRKLFIETRAKSVIVVEDIDCSLDLTGQRAKTKKAEAEAANNNKVGGKDGKEDPNASKVTLSGLLNFIDGLWSACGGERIIVFTTNHVDRLDPALIRRGRMDKHIEMSYCCFQAFKFLAKNYLDVDAHPLFDAVSTLLREVDITPADVAELLMPKRADEDVDACLAGLVEALEKAKAEKKPAKNNAADHEGEEIVEDE
ncbi:hypothetical protein QOZ80_7AG0559390 [Eleusine coracana subsp. coracana]|nr:hypothetical protein QOZ80_7AG0559390 [Eleusine coracana subsp. coracana]